MTPWSLCDGSMPLHNREHDTPEPLASCRHAKLVGAVFEDTAGTIAGVWTLLNDKVCAIAPLSSRDTYGMLFVVDKPDEMRDRAKGPS